MGTIVFIAILVINVVTGGAAIGTFFSAHPQDPPREVQSISSRETGKTDVPPPDASSGETHLNETPSAKER